MKTKLFGYLIGAALAAGAADFAAMAAEPTTEKTSAAAADWSEGGRWLVPYEMPGYDGGYQVVVPTAQQAATPNDEHGGSSQPPAPVAPHN